MSDKNNHEMIHHLPRIKWACRRGMLELDVILNHFVDEAYPSLSDDDKLLFINLLECTDPELFVWLMGKETPPEKGLVRITDIIRKHAISRI